jgi:hypothetical protein
LGTVTPNYPRAATKCADCEITGIRCGRSRFFSMRPQRGADIHNSSAPPLLINCHLVNLCPICRRRSRLLLAPDPTLYRHGTSNCRRSAGKSSGMCIADAGRVVASQIGQLTGRIILVRGPFGGHAIPTRLTRLGDGGQLAQGVPDILVRQIRDARNVLLPISLCDGWAGMGVDEMSGRSRISRMKRTIQCEHHTTLAAASRALLNGVRPYFSSGRRSPRHLRCRLLRRVQSHY